MDLNKITVACVLRSGGDYSLPDVLNLHGSVRRHFGSIRFVCLTDIVDSEKDVAGISFAPLKYNWPSWWSKMELFRLPGPVITMDLDIVPVGDCCDICTFVQSLDSETFMILKDFGRVPVNSSFMAWNRADMLWLTDSFAKDFQRATERISGSGHHLYINRRRYHGDQAYIDEKLGQKMKIIFAQDHFDGIDSYKWGVARYGFKKNQRLVCFHGKPRPLQVKPTPEWLSREGWI